MKKAELGKEAQEALKYYRQNPKSLVWTALNVFRIYYPTNYTLDDGTVGTDIVSMEFHVKEVA